MAEANAWLDRGFESSTSPKDDEAFEANLQEAIRLSRVGGDPVGSYYVDGRPFTGGFSSSAGTSSSSSSGSGLVGRPPVLCAPRRGRVPSDASYDPEEDA